jgi:hypothetical protein
MDGLVPRWRVLARGPPTAAGDRFVIAAPALQSFVIFVVEYVFVSFVAENVLERLSRRASG